MLAVPPPQAAQPDTCPLIFRGVVSQEEQIAFFPAGWTLQQMLGDNAAYSLRVTVGGVEVPRTVWPHVRPRAGTRIHVEFWPEGGGGTRKWILTAVAIVATIFSYGAYAGAAWATIGGLSTTTVMIGGAMIAGLAMSLIAPPIPRLTSGSDDPLDTMSSLTGTQNNLNPGGAIPLVIGDCYWMLVPSPSASGDLSNSMSAQLIDQLLGPTSIALKPGEQVISQGRRFYRPMPVPGQVPRDVAIHEAGHAVAAWWTGHGIKSVHARERDRHDNAVGAPIITSDGIAHAVSPGLTESGGRYIEGADEREQHAFCKRLTRRQLNDVVIRTQVLAMAGPMAEGLLKGYGLTHETMTTDPGYRLWQEGDPPSDLHTWLAASYLPKPKDRRRVASGSVKLTAAMLALHWPKVLAVADALQERRSLTGTEVLEVIGQEARPRHCSLNVTGLDLAHAKVMEVNGVVARLRSGPAGGVRNNTGSLGWD